MLGSADLSDEAFVTQVESAELPAAAFRLWAIAVLSFVWLKPGFAQEQPASKEEIEEVKGALQGLSESAVDTVAMSMRSEK